MLNAARERDRERERQAQTQALAFGVPARDVLNTSPGPGPPEARRASSGPLSPISPALIAAAAAQGSNASLVVRRRSFNRPGPIGLSVVTNASQLSPSARSVQSAASASVAESAPATAAFDVKQQADGDDEREREREREALVQPIPIASYFVADARKPDLEALRKRLEAMDAQAAAVLADSTRHAMGLSSAPGSSMSLTGRGTSGSLPLRVVLVTGPGGVGKSIFVRFDHSLSCSGSSCRS